MAVALLLPVTLALDPTGALIMLAGVYYGGLFGDSITGILLNTPGNSSAIAATFEGHRMALDGRAAQALAAGADFTLLGPRSTMIASPKSAISEDRESGTMPLRTVSTTLHVNLT